ncbi:YbaB/EbfC family nucleoid-associated protein [Egibacter rhizosphaerae]|uniref:Nucleoid-associated protein ER308_07785 n=1 Tax=Egibacter rhizosphaerae TaxID=1670831 RepID=A0A411YEB2_9ACTN|nr:YbaB/EbfC family nucleoid-associated protein [Egibacter rhizosphaerae]QBI19462.1 YbaB/EbfC family nucleoid-associated protein [Egibacter rhizosphaerae]
MDPQMMRQAQEMQAKLEQAQQQIAAADVSGSAGGGMVTVTLNGTGSEARAVEISPDVVDPEDVEMLQDLVVAAVNEALRAANEYEQDQLGGLAGELGLPPGMV